jgi:signal transduction histidine kinase
VVTGNQHHVDIAVHDQGPGIAAEFRDKIFEKFYRIPNDTAYKVKGTGVGLFLSRYFAELIGGSLLLESTEGRGSTFTLRLARRGRA